jgi:hypothetical protein
LLLSEFIGKIKYYSYKSLVFHGFQEVSRHCVLSEISYSLTAQWANLRLAHPFLDALLAVVVHARDCDHGLIQLLEADGAVQDVHKSSFAALWDLKDGNL